MKYHLTEFYGNRRGAVAVLFAITLVPLVLLVALTIDFSFFTEARSQIELAADAGATHAVRAATATYALETTEGISNAQAQVDAETAGNIAGADWFNAQLGQMPTAYVPPAANGKPDPYVNTVATTAPAGFSAAVTYDGIYPPFFNSLFQASQPWNVAGTSGAAAAYSYVEILMLLDTSNSMLLGASAADIKKMSVNTVCMDPNDVTSISNPPNGIGDGGDNPLYLNNTLIYDAPYTSDHNQIDFKTAGAIPFYTPGGADGTKGSCDADHQVPAFSPQNFAGNNGYAGTPCALACHISTNKSATDGQFDDLYGFDRHLNVTLRLDVVLQATEQVLTSMIETEQASNQFSVGLYQFNTGANNYDGTDVGVLAPGTQGTASDPTEEATYDLPSVLQDVYNIDYTHKPEDSFPPIYAPPPGQTGDSGNTNFPTAVTNLVNGTATGGKPLQAVAANAGQTAGNPAKDIFIVTDGMEDECGFCGPNPRVMGEMTSVAAETGTSAQFAPICGLLKAKGFTVYVLYVTYFPPPHLSVYRIPGYSPTDDYTMADYPLLDGSEREMDQPASNTGVTPINPAYPGDSPNASALRACASDPAKDFYTATDGAEIAQAMSAMLKSALSSAIRVTE